MAYQTTDGNTIVEVIQTRRVVYKKHKALFLTWHTIESVTCLGKDLVIETNDEINNVYFNSKKINICK